MPARVYTIILLSDEKKLMQSRTTALAVRVYLGYPTGGFGKVS